MDAKKGLRYRWHAKYDRKKPLYFNVFDPVHKSSGFYRVTPGSPGKMLVFGEARYRDLQVAENSERFTFTRERYDEPVNVYSAEDNFAHVRRLSDLNPQQRQMLWGKAELIQYKVQEKPLQGILIYPADYQPGRRYPMIVHIYQFLSDDLHLYRPPDFSDFADATVFSQNGYFVLLPDIDYRPQHTFQSASECLTAAVQTVLKTDRVDPKRVGLMGGSYGGYGTCVGLAGTRLFAAGVAQAAPTDLFTEFARNPDYMQNGQYRMQKPVWEAPGLYVENSPLFHLHAIAAPLLLIVGGHDPNVTWTQSAEMFQGMRQQGKNVTLLLYPDEGHALNAPSAQEDAAHRVRHFFDHYLKNAPAEDWLNTP